TYFPPARRSGRANDFARRRLLSYQERGRSIHPAKQAAGAHSLVCYPLIVADEIVGLLYVYRCDEVRFSEVELLLLDNFVNLAGLAIHHGRQVGGMTRALARKVNQLEKLERASRLVSSRTSLDETLHEILAIGLDLTAAQYGSFELYNKQRHELSIRALAGRPEGLAVGPPCR
ncbi:MAG: GAF domain-containing protein, partial [Anaerolineales bacterium]|nr:GAF domain-containing protein [Anaerolineales bacterium]